VEDTCGPLPLSSMLALRQTNRIWKRATDSSLDTIGDSRTLNLYNFSERNELIRFTDHANGLASGGNPFIGRCLRVIVTNHEMLHAVVQILRRHGHNLKNVTLGSTLSQLNLLNANLIHIPNVETLTINACWTHLDNLFDLVTLPTLARLKILKINVFNFMENDLDQVPDNEQMALIDFYLKEYGHQLSVFESPPIILRLDGIGNRLANLAMLWLEGSTGQALTREDLGILAQVDWKLKIMRIAGFSVGTSVELYVMLNSFSTTLQWLILEINMDLDPSHLVVFPLLENVRLTVNAGLGNIWSGKVFDLRLASLSRVAPNLVDLEITAVGDGALRDVTIPLIGTMFPKLITFKINRPS